MKKRIIAGLLILCLFCMSSCKEEKKDRNKKYKKCERETVYDRILDLREEAIDKKLQILSPVPSIEDDEDIEQIYSVSFSNEEKPELTEVSLIVNYNGPVNDLISISDMYKIDYYHSAVVGLVGSPINVQYDKEYLKNPILCFTYDANELRWVPEDNLIVLHYNEKTGFYDTVEGSLISKANSTCKVEINEAGIYMLVDAYDWYGVWGGADPEYKYDADYTLYPSDWERENNTGSIMELVDKKWAVDNAPDFTVSTPEELASVVYYVNAFANPFDEINVTLSKDIDLTGYEWKPMGWNSAYDHPFVGTIDGQGHTITGMNIEVDYENCGFIGYSYDVVMKDINFVDAYVSGTKCTGIAGGEIYGTNTWNNVHTSGTVIGSYDYGGIVGREASLSFVDCSTSFDMNDDETYEFMSYRKKMIDETEVVETFTLTLNDDYSITRDDFDGFKNLCWQIELDGVGILQRCATDPHTDEPELVLDTAYQWLNGETGTHTIYLTAYNGEFYVRVSNIIEYTID